MSSFDINKFFAEQASVRYNQDWRQKFIELSETLAETRADLEDFQQSSKELEEEMNLEIIRTEKVQQELKGKLARVETERDEWKVSCPIFVSSCFAPNVTCSLNS